MEFQTLKYSGTDGVVQMRFESSAVVQHHTAQCRVGLDTDTVELTVMTLASHLITLERIQFSRQFFTGAMYVRAEP